MGNKGLVDMPVPTEEECQQPQAPMDRHGPGYDNDVPNNWLRGNGTEPGFDKHKAGR